MNPPAEQLARYLRHTKGVRIDIYRTIIPEGWTPHPVVARKTHRPITMRTYAKAIAAWRHTVNVSKAVLFPIEPTQPAT